MVDGHRKSFVDVGNGAKDVPNGKMGSFWNVAHRELTSFLGWRVGHLEPV